MGIDINLLPPPAARTGCNFRMGFFSGGQSQLGICEPTEEDIFVSLVFC